MKSPLNKILSESSEKKILKFKKDEYLFHENGVSDGVYFLISGKVKIIRNENRPAGMILYLAKPGDILGIHAVINEHNFTSSSVALVNTFVCFVPAEEFRVLVSGNNDYKMNVMKLLCSNIDLIENKITSRTEKTASERFAELLVLLADTYGISENNALKIDLSMDDLANLSGTSKGYLNKIIADFSQKEWISYKGNTLKIFNHDILEKEAKV
jgi:CRP-like cAMP-binding protein